MEDDKKEADPVIQELRNEIRGVRRAVVALVFVIVLLFLITVATVAPNVIAFVAGTSVFSFAMFCLLGME
ncbi:MAG: hypothetical protein ACPGVU_25130 [Limisphaerales bacterium]